MENKSRRRDADSPSTIAQAGLRRGRESAWASYDGDAFGAAFVLTRGLAAHVARAAIRPGYALDDDCEPTAYAGGCARGAFYTVGAWLGKALAPLDFERRDDRGFHRAAGRRGEGAPAPVDARTLVATGFEPFDLYAVETGGDASYDLRYDELGAPIAWHTNVAGAPVAVQLPADCEARRAIRGALCDACSDRALDRGACADLLEAAAKLASAHGACAGGAACAAARPAEPFMTLGMVDAAGTRGRTENLVRRVLPRIPTTA